MKNLIYAFLVISTTVWGQVKQERKVGEFSSLEISQGIQVQYTSGPNKKIVVETDSKELLPYIKTQVNGKNLRIFIENKQSRGLWSVNTLKFQKLVVYIENPELESVQVQSSAKVFFTNKVSARRFHVSVSSSGLFKGDILTDELVVRGSSSADIQGTFTVANEVDLALSSSAEFSGAIAAHSLYMRVSSSGKSYMKGSVVKADVEVSSSGKVNASDFKIMDLKAIASSSGKGEFTVIDTIEAKATSSGHLHYKGNPKVILAKTSSSGKINKI